MSEVRLVRAIKKCLFEKRGTRTTAKMYSIPRTTLQRFLKKTTEKFGCIDHIADKKLLEFVQGCMRRVPSNQVLFFT